ncbi:uncharacterized protein LOC110375778 [Helicoverpa armigera]|uniref:Uncharacterized protein n=1 Tax=Helicoverpa armigera TaxID=29058 RepID=A0A2W1C092_HELAM|nr:hypothetical protein B5X24_HaOG202096 [Helicoverpa armigera]
MNSDELNDRKQKLNNIIKKITESQLLKIREADSNVRTVRPDCKFTMNPQERDNEMHKAMSTKMINDKELCHFATSSVSTFKSEVGTSELPSALPKPVGPGVPL